MSRIKFPEFFNVGVGALELFNEAKDSVAVTLRDLTHDAKRLAPFDVTQPPQAGVGGKDGGGVFAEPASGMVQACVRVCYAANSPIQSRRQAFDRHQMKRRVMNLTVNSA